jgi:hypothetical protein
MLRDKPYARFDRAVISRQIPRLAVEIASLAEIERLQIRVKVSSPAQNLPDPAFYPHVLPTR